MICPKCGYETTGNYCSNCGAPLMAKSNDIDDFSPYEMPENDNAAFEHEYTENLGAERETAASRPRISRKRSDSGSVSTAAARNQKKEMKKKDARLKKLESRLEQMQSRAEESSKSIKRMESDRSTESGKTDKNAKRAVSSRRQYRDSEWIADRNRDRSISANSNHDSNSDLAGAAYKAVKTTGAGAIVFASRLMQFASAFLMAAMTAVMLRSFWEHGQALGDIRFIAAERNYALAFYAGFAAVSLFMGLVWCLWILSRKGAGGGLRMKKYDTGRGFLPFVICMAVIVAAGVLKLKIPEDQQMWRGILKGVHAVLDAIHVHQNGLFICSGVGAVLSFIRKLLRV